MKRRHLSWQRGGMDPCCELMLDLYRRLNKLNPIGAAV